MDAAIARSAAARFVPSTFLAVVVGASILGAGEAHAQMYFAADGMVTKVKITDNTGVPPIVTGETNAGGVRLRLGGEIKQWLDVEAHLGFTGKNEYSTAGGSNTVQATTYGLYAKPKVRMSAFTLYGLIGLAGVSYSFEGPVSGSEDTGGFGYGAGVQFAFNKNWALSLDYMRHPKGNLPVRNLSGGIDAELRDTFSLGIIYTFAK